MRHENFDWKSWYAPFLSISFFRYQKFSGKQKGSFTKLFVSVMWDKKFDKTVMPPSYAWKFLKRIFLKHQSVLQWNISIQWDKNSDGKSWYSPPPYSNFCDTRIYCNIKGFPYGNFRHWEKKFSTENLDTPPPLFYPNFFGTRNKWNTKRFACEIFRHCETKNFR